MEQKNISEAAELLWNTFKLGHTIESIPSDIRPRDRKNAYRIQQSFAEMSGSDQLGWKIAATSENGQKHIGVSGPLAGRLLTNRSKVDGESLELGANIMAVAEAEFCFRLKNNLPPRKEIYSIDEVLDAIDTLHPAIEIPDSRFDDFVTAGEAQLIADNACASWFILGNPTTENWRDIDLKRHTVDALINGQIVETGIGSNVLGDPLIALTWITNELSQEGIGLKSGEIVTTGTCVIPFAIKPGDKVCANFGNLGRVEIQLT